MRTGREDTRACTRRFSGAGLAGGGAPVSGAPGRVPSADRHPGPLTATAPPGFRLRGRRDARVLSLRRPAQGPTRGGRGRCSGNTRGRDPARPFADWPVTGCPGTPAPGAFEPRGVWAGSSGPCASAGPGSAPFAGPPAAGPTGAPCGQQWESRRGSACTWALSVCACDRGGLHDAEVTRLPPDGAAQGGSQDPAPPLKPPLGPGWPSVRLCPPGSAGGWEGRGPRTPQGHGLAVYQRAFC